MLRSLSSGISGLRNHQTRMDVIADNIANVNTVSFKYSRVIFKDVLSQSIRGSSSSAVGAGSVNPSQVGMGVTVGSIDRVFTQGISDPTSRSTDLVISGNGFFAVADYLGDNPGINDIKAEDIYLTREGAFYINDDGYLVNSLGQYVMGILADQDGSPKYVVPINLKDVDLDGTVKNSENEYIESVSFDRDGMLTINGATIFDGNKLYVGVFQHENPEALVRYGNNLYECPREDAENLLTNSNINKEDTTGLNFGGWNGAGDIFGGNLEASNVDLSLEFSNMIITQRGYQANARIITVSDSMLQELVDLKR